jgi:hypothetical protein
MGTIASSRRRRAAVRSGRRGSFHWRIALGVAACRAAGLAVFFALAAAPARADSTAVAGFGLVGPDEGDRHSAVLDLEYRFKPWRFGIGPAIGASATSDGGAYLRAGFSRDFAFAERWNANITLAGGGYQPGHGKRLGKGFEFRSAIDVSYEAQPGVRLGAALAHLSNAGLSDSNPGVETITITIAFTPSRMIQRR